MSKAAALFSVADLSGARLPAGVIEAVVSRQLLNLANIYMVSNIIRAS